MIVYVLLESDCDSLNADCCTSIVMGVLSSEGEALDWVSKAPNRGYRVFQLEDIHE